MNTVEQYRGKVVVMAGNPRLENTKEGLQVDVQPAATAAAFGFIKNNRERVARVYLAFDHTGSFIEQFADSTQKISNRRLKHLRLDMLIPQIQIFYRELCEEFQIPLNSIHIISEDQCRAGALNSRHIASRHRNPLCGDTERFCDTDRINCSEITAEIINRMARHGDQLELYWELNAVRCRPAVIKKGTQLAKDIYHLDNIPVRHSFVSPNDIFEMDM